MRYLNKHILCAFFFTFSLNVFATDADGSTYVIELRNQPPEILIPTLKPLLRDGDTVSGFNHQLIVNSSPQRIDGIRTLVQQLDKPLHNLMISVKNNNIESGTENNSGFSGGIRREHIVISTGEPLRKQEGLTVRSDGLAYSTNTTQHSSNTRAEHQVRTVEGSPAFIYTGESRHYPTRNADGEIESTEVNANKGFYVTARLAGDRVLLDIVVSNDEFNPPTGRNSADSISTRQLSTTVSGRLGEWISLGGITLSDTENEKTLAKKITTGSSSLGDVSIKINALEQ
jgi:type II secretory pathway component GspD/PulD (secretin)